MLGHSENRVATARQIMLIIARRSFAFFAVVFFFLAVQSAVSLTHLSSATFLFLIIVGLSGFCFWIVAKWFVFWSRMSAVGLLIGGILFVIVLLLIASLSVLDVIPVLGEVPQLSRDMIRNVGSAKCLALTSLLVAITWFCYLYDAPLALGNDHRLLE